MIRLVVVDLDNTLYDWVSYYVPAFEAMVSDLERRHGVNREILLDAFQRVHRKHGTSEYAFALTELDELRDLDLMASAAGEAIPPIATFRQVGAKSLRLYDGVAETLKRLHREGRAVVAYTDAMLAYADVRLEQLGIADQFDELVASQNHAVPKVAADAASYFPVARFAGPRIARHATLNRRERKPQPTGLARLVDRWGVSPSETVYVGDSLTRDVAMAQAAGVHDVLAAYGRSYDSSLWQRLVRVTHWTPAAAIRETERAQDQIVPSHEIQTFSELAEVIRKLDRLPVATDVSRVA